MAQISFRKLAPFLLSGLSLIAIILTFMLVFYTPITVQEDSVAQRLIVGSTFGSLCTFGAIAVFFPGKCSRTVNPKNWRKATSKHYSLPNLDNAKTTSILILKLTHGHHPDCGNFSDHEFKVGRKTFCAGCMGLLIGASVSLIATSLYFSSQFQIDGSAAAFLLGFGFIAIPVGFLSPIFLGKGSLIRLTTNTFFILGMSSTLLGADALLHNIHIDLYIIALNILWLITRISLSELNHSRTCAKCSRRCM